MDKELEQTQAPAAQENTTDQAGNPALSGFMEDVAETRSGRPDLSAVSDKDMIKELMSRFRTMVFMGQNGEDVQRGFNGLDTYVLGLIHRAKLQVELRIATDLHHIAEDPECEAELKAWRDQWRNGPAENLPALLARVRSVWPEAANGESE